MAFSFADTPHVPEPPGTPGQGRTPPSALRREPESAPSVPLMERIAGRREDLQQRHGPFPQLPKDDHSLDDCALRLLDWLSAMDPTWSDRLAVLRDEQGFTPLQALGSCVAYVLDWNLQMMIPKHDAFQGQPWGAQPHPCPVCGVTFTPTYPNQPLCGNACAKVYYGPMADQAVRSDTAEAPEESEVGVTG